MAKIFYAVQATGNGHVSRATQLYPYLKKFGEVDFFVSGNNCNLDFNFPVKYRSKGCSLHYSKCGGLNYWSIIKNIKPYSLYKDASSLPIEKYDYIINDFDFVTSLACKLKGIPSVQFGHQASFQSDLTPRPENKSIIGETILKKYAPATQYLGLHFESYDSYIKNPVIKNEFINANPKDLGHVSVYLPSFQQHCLFTAFKKCKHIEFHWFLDTIQTIQKDENITFYPVNQNLFNESLMNCHGLLTGGGFETPSEALFMGKKLISIPIKNHYEQECNAAALKKMGIKVLYDVDDNFDLIIKEWYENPNLNKRISANNINETLTYLFDQYPKKSLVEKEEPVMMFI
jgi:uncharacterized protein (TIGR00661 family)